MIGIIHEVLLRFAVNASNIHFMRCTIRIHPPFRPYIIILFIYFSSFFITIFLLSPFFNRRNIKFYFIIVCWLRVALKASKALFVLSSVMNAIMLNAAAQYYVMMVVPAAASMLLQHLFGCPFLSVIL